MSYLLTAFAPLRQSRANDALARRAAARLGLRAEKSTRQRGTPDNHGGFRLIDPEKGTILDGSRYDLSAEGLIAKCGQLLADATARAPTLLMHSWHSGGMSALDLAGVGEHMRRAHSEGEVSDDQMKAISALLNALKTVEEHSKMAEKVGIDLSTWDWEA